MIHMLSPNALKLLLAMFLATFLLSPALANTIPAEKTGSVSGVLDGHTFTLNSGETLRLAGIETPQPNQPGYSSSSGYLSTLLPHGATVFLDIDSTRVVTQGVLLCVVYLDYNSTHYENINKAMLQSQYAYPNGTNSIFDPTSWTQQFIPKESDVSPSSLITIAPSITPSPTPFIAPSLTLDPSIFASPTVPEFPGVLLYLVFSLTSAALIMQQYAKKRSKK